MNSFPASSDPAHATLVRGIQGKPVAAQIAVVEVNIIDEDLPRMLQFEQGGLDYIGIRGEVANRLLADGALKPEYARRGITRRVFPEPFLFSFYFNVADPVLGGMDSERIALRRAIASALDVETLIKVVYAGYALPANQIVPPGVGGHDATLPKKSQYDPATAKALLDRFGYAKGADGYRTTPDGKPLTLVLTLRSSPVSREIQTLTKRDLDVVGLRTDYRLTPFQDAIKELERGTIPDVLRRLRRFASRGGPELLPALQQAAAAGQRLAVHSSTNTTVPPRSSCVARAMPSR